MRSRSTLLLTVGAFALVSAAPAASIAAPAPAGHDTTAPHHQKYPLGPSRVLPNGLHEVRTQDGHVSTTHGADAHATASAPNVTPVATDPACATTQRTFVFYMSPADRPYRYDGTMIARLRTYVRDMTGFIKSEGLNSSGGTKGPLLKVACNSDNSIRVAGLKSTTTSSLDSFATIKQDLINAGFSDPNTKYLVFYDDPAVNTCGLGELSYDDAKVTTNANNVGAKYAVVYGNTSTYTCWNWHTALHESFHTMGAVQNGAPYSSGAGHCNDGRDVMCYGDGGPTSNFSETRCGTTRLDCGYDTFYDTVTESGEWLATHWNLGWSGNAYLQF